MLDRTAHVLPQVPQGRRDGRAAAEGGRLGRWDERSGLARDRGGVFALWVRKPPTSWCLNGRMPTPTPDRFW